MPRKTGIRIEDALHQFPSYGHKRLAIALSANKKRVRRVMRLFGIKPYSRRPKRPWKKRDHGAKDKCQETERHRHHGTMKQIYFALLIRVFLS